IQALEEESLLSLEEEFERAISTAHAEDISAWVEVIAQCITDNSYPIRLMDLQKAVQLPIIETWLGLLLGDFNLEQRGEFYDSSGIWITGSW
ncbi:MAG: hypothetical protein ACOVVP_12425, partial [Pseudanabaena sp.]